MKSSVKQFFHETKLLLRSVPPLPFSLFLLSVFAMNLLANKSIVNLEWLALDCGILVSWVAFLCMDVMTKHFGPRAATTVSVVAIGINLVMCLILFAAGAIPGDWGAYYDFGEEPVVNSALDATFGGTWYVLLGSTVAFISSAFINNFSNWGVGKIFKKHPDGFLAYACRTYVSTAIGQFADNLIFAFIVSFFFFGWTPLKCVTCALTGMVAELLVEAAFSPLGYKICNDWRKNNIGREYFEAVKGAEHENSDHGVE